MRKGRQPFTVTIEDIEQRGYGVARHEGKVIFVEDALPGETVEVHQTKNKGSYAFARPMRLVVPSSDRVEPFCRHFGSCGGCKWQYLPYEKQLGYKEYFVRTALERIGGVADPPVRTILGAPRDRLYRNKLEFSFSPTRWLEEDEIAAAGEVADRRALGFHVRGWFDRVLDIEECWLQAEPSNRIRNVVRSLAAERSLSFHNPRSHVGLLRGLIVRTSLTGEVMVTLVAAPDDPYDGEGDEAPGDLAEALAMMEGVRLQIPEISSLNYIVSDRKNDSLTGLDAHAISGRPSISERCGHLMLRIDAVSFYQTNSEQAERLYSLVEELADLRGDEELLDLYSGAGSIGLYLARRVARVVGIETVPQAVARARENARANGITNARFQVGEVEKLLPGLLGGESGSDVLGGDSIPAGGVGVTRRVVVVDPPRSGLHPSAVKLLSRSVPGPIIYVSCNPATQARDIAMLSESYELQLVCPVDMFPQTHHIESVALLVPRVRRAL